MLPITFKIPLLPPSVNHQYKINYRTKCVYLDESVRSFKNKAILFIPQIKFDEKSNEKFRVHVEYYGNFHNKDGSTKRKDGQNLDKCLYDVMFEKWQIDDSRVWFGSWEKHHINDDEYTLVTLSSL